MTSQPRYDELPLLAGSDLRCGWDVFGAGDQLGTLNHLTAARRLAAAASIRSGECINLTLPLDQPDPPLFGRHRPVHEVFALNPFSWDDRLTLDPQASTQWDGLLHVKHRTAGFYGGRHQDPVSGGPLGIDQWVRHGLAGRGVLLDILGHFTDTGRSYDPLSSQPITADDLAEVADAQQVRLQPGDILCLRFGWLAAYRDSDEQARVAQSRQTSCAGLAATEETARYLWDSSIAAAVADNPSVEAMPGDREVGFLHHRLLTMFGMPLGELFALDELAERCRARGRWDFLFVANPLHVTGAIGSPGNALALL